MFLPNTPLVVGKMNGCALAVVCLPLNCYYWGMAKKKTTKYVVMTGTPSTEYQTFSTAREAAVAWDVLAFKNSNMRGGIRVVSGKRDAWLLKVDALGVHLNPLMFD